MTQTIVSTKYGGPPDLLVRQEELILDVTERLTEALDNAGVTKGVLAKRLGKSPGFVSQVLGGGRNLTLRTISDIAAALSLRPMFQFASESESWLEVTARWQYEARPRLEIDVALSHVKSKIPATTSKSFGDRLAA